MFLNDCIKVVVIIHSKINNNSEPRTQSTDTFKYTKGLTNSLTWTCVYNFKDNDIIVAIFATDLICFMENIIISLEVHIVDRDSANDTVCTARYISKYGTSNSAFFGRGWWVTSSTYFVHKPRYVC